MLRLVARLNSCVAHLPSINLHTSSTLSSMELTAVVSSLEKIAPTKRAEDWDNVGLLVEPQQSGLISRVLLTNDLTEEVMDEVERSPGDKIHLIISYHPPIFRPFKRLTQASAKERIILRAIQSGMSVYSPHTALDNMDGGINEWLLSGVGEGEITALGVAKASLRYSNIVEVRGMEGEGEVKSVEDMVSKMDGVEMRAAPLQRYVNID